jgi:hypothetical protein
VVPSSRTPSPASLRQPGPRPRATRAVRSARTVQIKSGAYPLDRSTVGRVHRACSRPRVSIASALRQRQPITVRHMAHPQPLRRLPWQFCKKNPQFPEFTTIPFHLNKSLSIGSFLLCLSF